MAAPLQNPNPTLHDRKERPAGSDVDLPDDVYDAWKVFELIRDITDPEHPNSLEELNVLEADLITVSEESRKIDVQFTPTIPHCSMATLIGLTIRVQLMRTLPRRYRVGVRITPETHVSEAAINKQLADKERVAAALENEHLISVINDCLKPREY